MNRDQVNLKWNPFLSLFKREVKRFFKVSVQTLFAPLVNSTLYLLIFGVSVGSQIQMSGEIPYLAFIIPGLIMMGCLNNAFTNSSSSIVGTKFSGELEDYKSSPLTLNQIIWALSLGGLLRGLLVSLITFVVGQVFYWFQYEQFLAVAHPLWLLFYLFVGGLSFANFGLSAAIWAKSFDHLSAVGNFILLPLIYLGGVFYSIERLPAFWQKISQLNPLLYLINGVRYSLLGHSDVSHGLSAMSSISMLVIFYVIAKRSLRSGSFHRW